MNQNSNISDNNPGQALLHTPTGVRDTYGAECASKLSVQESVHNVMSGYGFKDIETPTFEYFDIFSKERGTASSREMFKFFDRDNNTLVLRPDVTPSIARCVAKYYKDEDMQIRLCYTGSTFVNTPPYKGKLQEVTQVGAELFNDGTSDADAEMIALTIECLLKSGLEEFQLEIGHADLFRGLVEEAGLSDDDASKLQKLIEAKNFFGVEELLDSLTISEDLKEVILKLPELLDNLDDSIEFVSKRSKSERVKKAIDRLKNIEDILNIYGFSDYITIDLSMLSHYSYYTGVIFRAYTYGNGEAVATGGRYDGLVKQFGKESEAIGLAIVIDQLMLALSRQKLIDTDALDGSILLYSHECREETISLASKLRSEGKKLQLMRKSSKRSIDDYKEYAKRMKIEKMLYLDDEKNITEYDFNEDKETKRKLSDY